MNDWELTVGTTTQVNPLLTAKHYLGPLKAAQLVLVAGPPDDPIGCMVWRKPTSRRLPSDGSWLELSRWCLTPDLGDYAGSRMHRKAVALLRDTFPHVTTLVSYSDPAAGHTGALYKSCNWLWAPTWHRLRPPPTGNGNWGTGAQHVKDRWVFPLQPDQQRGPLLAVDDAGAIRRWAASQPSAKDVRLALASPAPDLAQAARQHPKDDPR